MDAATLHREALVIDGHVDLPTRLRERPADTSCVFRILSSAGSAIAAAMSLAAPPDEPLPR